MFRCLDHSLLGGYGPACNGNIQQVPTSTASKTSAMPFEHRKLSLPFPPSDGRMRRIPLTTSMFRPGSKDWSRGAAGTDIRVPHSFVVTCIRRYPIIAGRGGSRVAMLVRDKKLHWSPQFQGMVLKTPVRLELLDPFHCHCEMADYL